MAARQENRTAVSLREHLKRTTVCSNTRIIGLLRHCRVKYLGMYGEEQKLPFLTRRRGRKALVV